MNNSKILILLIAQTLTSCDKPKTFEYYMEHKEEMRSKVKECMKMDPAKVRSDKECQNALNAEQKLMLSNDGEKRMPHIKLD